MPVIMSTVEVSCRLSSASITKTSALAPTSDTPIQYVMRFQHGCPRRLADGGPTSLTDRSTLSTCCSVCLFSLSLSLFVLLLSLSDSAVGMLAV